ncbi:MAG TPA: carboxypeptidase regulatory-like domain-containing protein [Vicinamibacterales bacterium]|nr:carboxypeptidase regulatory-like domain-containing protein [Vicinamibacterales bacterium]
MIRNMFALALAATLAAAGNASAYEAIAVTDGGTLAGTVKLDGAKPAPETFDVTKDTQACGTSKTKTDLVVADGGGIANVVVAVKAAKGKALEVPSAPITFDQKGCEYQPHVLAFPAGSTLEILNPDGVLHNVHATGSANPEKNVAMPKFKKKIEWKVEQPEWPIAVKCDAHPWMHAYWISMEHPYYAVTDASGAFSIGDLPAGDYEVEVWHETLGKKTEKVTVPAGGTATVAWTMSKS